MSEPPSQFTRMPRRKPDKGKRVALSPEAKQAYADLMRERAEKETAYGQHMPPDMKR